MRDEDHYPNWLNRSENIPPRLKSCFSNEQQKNTCANRRGSLKNKVKKYCAFDNLNLSREISFMIMILKEKERGVLCILSVLCLI